MPARIMSGVLQLYVLDWLSATSFQQSRRSLYHGTDPRRKEEYRSTVVLAFRKPVRRLR